MTVLGIDTATAVASVGVFRAGTVLAQRSDVSPRGHAAGLAALVAAVLGDGGLDVPEVDALAVSVGPGSFTGLRIGLSFAKGIAYVTGARLVGVPTLEALARVAPAEGSWVAACLDARKGEVYLAIYEREAVGLAEATPAVALAPEAAATEIARFARTAAGFVVGDAAETYPEAFGGLDAGDVRVLSFVEVHPQGGEVARAGWDRLRRGEAVEPHALVPQYVRPSAAEVGRPGAR